MKNNNTNKKVNFTVKIMPWFMAISGDLLFWVAISTIFLTTVKGFTAAQISSLTTIGSLVTIILYPISFKIIKKIGNINSIKLGTLLLLFASILMTFFKSYFIILIGYILYCIAFLFKYMDNVVLRKDLKYQNKEQDYIKYQNKYSFIYSSLTMFIAFISGFLFNLNNYLPMIFCIMFCIVNVFLSNLLYEYNDNKKEIIEKKKNCNFKISNVVLLILLLYAFMYGVIALGQSNVNLFIQDNLLLLFKINKVSIFMSIIITISRIVRVISNYIFSKYCNYCNKLLYKIGFAILIAFSLIIVGGIINLKFINIVLMSIGFFIFYGIRDLFDNYMKTLLLNNCEEKHYEKAITYLTLSRTIGTFIISIFVTLLLLKIDMLYVIIFLLIISFFNLLIINKILKLTK